jgi:hypothetical protein
MSIGVRRLPFVHINWVAGELKTHDDTVEFNDYHQATVYLVMRQVRD